MNNLENVLNILKVIAEILGHLNQMGVKVNGEVNLPEIVGLFNKP